MDKGDVIIGMDGDFNVCWWSGGKALLNQRLCCLKPNKSINCRFMYYFLPVPLKAINDLTWFTTVKHLSSYDVLAIRFSYPPLPEQQSIAAFLDRKTQAIDAVIQKKERLIALLQEKRQALISQAVTKGLDAGAPMKDSGIEWLGEIPVHWEVKKVGYIATSIQTGPFGSQLHAEDYIEDGVPIVNPSNLKDGLIIPDYKCSIDEVFYLRLQRHSLCEGDIVFARRGEMGRCGLVTAKEIGWLCGTGSLRIRPDQTVCLPRYLNFLLTLKGIRDWLTLESVGSTMDNLNTGILSRLPTLLPPLVEQQAIIAFLGQKTQAIYKVIRKVENQLEKLREYRQTIISAAVTGNMDVREVVR